MVDTVYSVTTLVLALILVIINGNVHLFKTINGKSDRIYIILNIWVVLFCIIDAIWGVAAMGFFESNTMLTVMSYIYHISVSVATVLWVLYVSEFYDGKKCHKLFFMIVSVSAFVFQIVVLAMNVRNHNYFMVDEAGNYISGQYRTRNLYVQYAVYLLIGIFALFSAIRSRGEKRKKAIAILAFMTAPIIAGVFQHYFINIPALSIGYVLGCCIIFTFIVQKENEKLKYEEFGREYEKERRIEAENANKAMREAYGIIKGLSAEYHTLCRINGETLEIAIIRSSGKTTIQKAIQLVSSGKDYDTVINKYIDTFVVEGYREGVREKVLSQKIINTLSEDEIFTVNYLRRTDEGVESYHQMAFAKIDVEDSDTADFILAFRDVDEIVREEIQQQDEMKEQYYIFEALTHDYSNVYKVDFDTGLMEVFANRHKGADEMLHINNGEKYSFRDVMMNYIISVVHPDDRDEVRNEFNFEKIRKNLLNNRNYSFTYRIFQDNSVHNIYCSITCVGKDEDFHNIIIAFRNIDEAVEKEKKSKQELEMALDAARRADKAKSAFLFSMSHDIRTPMNAIIGYASLLLNGDDLNEKQRKYLTSLMTSGDHLLCLINNVLETAKIESGNIELKEQCVSCSEMVKDVQDVFLQTAKIKDIELNTSIDIHHDWVWADKTRLNQVALNIVGNAMKYTTSGYVKFSIKEVSHNNVGYGNYELIVEDSGQGISKEFLPHIFEPFAREKNVTDSKIAGTGLGLGITKRLVEIMNGSMEIESEVGKGTRVVISIPLKIADNGGPVDYDSPKKAVNLDNMKILVAEDNEYNAEIAKDVLVEAGATVDIARDGIECIDMLTSHEGGYYDVILMDVQMPNMDGLLATREIRKLDKAYSDVKIIAMTANAFEEDRRNCFEAGMDGFLSKPVYLDTLLETMSGIK